MTATYHETARTHYHDRDSEPSITLTKPTDCRYIELLE